MLKTTLVHGHESLFNDLLNGAIGVIESLHIDLEDEACEARFFGRVKDIKFYVVESYLYGLILWEREYV